MKVKTRSGKLEDLSLDKIKNRIQNLVQKYNLQVDVDALTLSVINSLYDNISTSQLDDETARIAANNISEPDSIKLASVICIDNHHKNTKKSFVEKFTLLYEADIIDEPYFKIVQQYSSTIEEAIDYELDFFIDYFGFKTLEKAYLLKIDNRVIERPQDLFMREAIGLHVDKKNISNFNGKKLDKVLETYKYLSQGYMTHATPTLFHACTKKSAFSSCFLLATEDSVEGLYETVKNCARISKHAGGIGLHVSNVRANGTDTVSKGKAGGVVPYLKVLNETARHINQNGKRPGSIAIYIETYHPDIFDFLEMKINKTKEEFRALDLFYALWISDLFMEKVKADEDWYLMCPYECPGLDDVYGQEFIDLYDHYVSLNKYRKKIKAQDLWKAILRTQIETGTPYLCYKDAANKKSNQKNLGTIKSSNLCVAPETLILTSKGYFQIKDLENKKVEVWNGKEWSLTTIHKTNTNQELLRVYFNNDDFVDCTPYHNFYIENENGYKIVEAKNLKKGMILMECSYPIIDTCCDYNIDEEVPINENINSKLRYLESLVSSTKYIVNSDELQGLTIINKNEYGFVEVMRSSLYKSIKYMLQTLGCNPFLQYDYDIYKYKLTISVKDLSTLHDLGFRSPFVKLEGNYPNPKNLKVKIERVIKTGRVDDTYCFNESQRHVGIFNGFPLGNCSEIIEYSDKDNIAVCNLASIALPKFVKQSSSGQFYFDFQLLKEISAICIENLNNVIDYCFYPTPETQRSNLAYRPLGLGVQGLAYTYMALGYAFESPEARKLNLQIFETIYYSALEKSMQLAKLHGPYQTFEHSPAAKGKLQFDLWEENHSGLDLSHKFSGMWDWKGLKNDIVKYGLRNSLLTTCMPTASTAQILGNSESIEPITSNMFTRRVISGEFIVFNPYLLQELKELKLWNRDMKDLLQYYNGSIQNIPDIPQSLKKKYKTVWEISQKEIIDQSVDRGLFIDQSQSLNLFMENPTYSKLTSMHFYAWSKGLKTGLYYLRTKSASSSDKVTVDKEKIAKILNERTIKACPYVPGQAPPDCEACSS